MDESSDDVTIAFRIPGTWSHPKELVERMPAGCRLTGDALVLPDGSQVDFGAAPADGQFAKIFRSSCRQPATPEELATVDGYKVNVFLSGPGGSLDAARLMMRAGSAIVRAGGAGVFIDNCALAHGGEHWLAMTEDGSSDAVSFAFVGIVRGRVEVYTMGMHVLGLRDVVMKRADADADEFSIIDVIRYMCAHEKPIENNHLLADLSGPRFHAFTEEHAEGPAGSPMRNPYGRLKLVSMRDMAERN